MTADGESLFETLADTAAGTEDGVARGKMMSSPGITYRGKVYAFFWRGRMTFRLGKGFVPEDHGVTEWQYLSPFKNKPPMTGWYTVSETHMDRWGDLADLALKAMRAELG